MIDSILDTLVSQGYLIEGNNDDVELTESGSLALTAMILAAPNDMISHIVDTLEEKRELIG